jgi:uncharacterized protein YggE
MRRSLSVAVLVAAALAFVSGCATPNQNGLGPGAPAPAAITARGTGEVTGTPDIATVVLGVATRAPGAQAALDANNQQANAVIAQLKGKGVADADLRTSGLSVDPTYDGQSNRITGYEVRNDVTVTIRDIAAAGGIIDAAAQAAGDAVRVQQLSFAIDDDSTLLAAARADAVKRARAQAQQLADAAGVSLGAVRSITETSGGQQPPVPMQRSDVAGSAASVPVQAGTQKLSLTVEMVYDIG